MNYRLLAAVTLLFSIIFLCFKYSHNPEAHKREELKVDTASTTEDRPEPTKPLKPVQVQVKSKPKKREIDQTMVIVVELPPASLVKSATVSQSSEEVSTDKLTQDKQYDAWEIQKLPAADAACAEGDGCYPVGRAGVLVVGTSLLADSTSTRWSGVFEWGRQEARTPLLHIR